MTHWSNEWLAATELVERGEVRAFDAVYAFTAPDGTPQRNTRLAATIGKMRKAGWDIETRQDGNHLASYHLRSVGEMPAGPHGRSRSGPSVHRPAVSAPVSPPRPTEPIARCKTCKGPLTDTKPSFDPNFVSGKCLSHLSLGTQLVRIS